MDANELLGKNLRALRKNSGKSVKDIADILGVTPTAVYAYESGRNKLPPESINVLANYFGYTHGQLLTEEIPVLDKIEIAQPEEIIYIYHNLLFDVITDASKNNPSFRAGIDMLLDDLDIENFYLPLNKEKLNSIVDYFLNSYVDNDIIEGLVMTIYIYLCIELLVLHPVLLDFILKELKGDNINIKEIMHEFISRNTEYESTNMFIISLKQIYTDNFKSTLMKLFRELYFEGQQEFAQFLHALRYFYGYSTFNDLKLSESVDSGLEMMHYLIYFDNKYAIKFISIFSEQGKL